MGFLLDLMLEASLTHRTEMYQNVNLSNFMDISVYQASSASYNLHYASEDPECST